MKKPYKAYKVVCLHDLHDEWGNTSQEAEELTISELEELYKIKNVVAVTPLKIEEGERLPKETLKKYERGV